jgi:hypothetical protein
VWGAVSRGICKFPITHGAEKSSKNQLLSVFQRLSGLVCDIDLSIFTE